MRAFLQRQWLAMIALCIALISLAQHEDRTTADAGGGYTLDVDAWAEEFWDLEETRSRQEEWFEELADHPEKFSFATDRDLIVVMAGKIRQLYVDLDMISDVLKTPPLTPTDYQDTVNHSSIESQ